MANPSDPTQIKTGFFHAGPQRSFHRQGQAVYESNYPSMGVVKGNYVLAPATPLPFAADQATLDAWIIANPGILRKYTSYLLTADPISNNELYFINDLGNGGRQYPFIQEQLMVDPATNQPANGYVVQLFQGAGGTSPGTQIGPSAGRWWISPDEGFFHFENGFTPVDMVWGAVSATVYVYIGDTVDTAISSVAGASAILQGETPPWGVIPSANTQLYIQVHDNTGNPFNYTLWAWASNETRHPGWRPCEYHYVAFYEHNDVPMVEIWYYDFDKGVYEDAPMVEVVDKSLTTLKSDQALIPEIVGLGQIKSLISTAHISEEVLITLINGQTSIINGSEINSFALNG